MSLQQLQNEVQGAAVPAAGRAQPQAWHRPRCHPALQGGHWGCTAPVQLHGSSGKCQGAQELLHSWEQHPPAASHLLVGGRVVKEGRITAEIPRQLCRSWGAGKGCCLCRAHLELGQGRELCQSPACSPAQPLFHGFHAIGGSIKPCVGSQGWLASGEGSQGVEEGWERSREWPGPTFQGCPVLSGLPGAVPWQRDKLAPRAGGHCWKSLTSLTLVLGFPCPPCSHLPVQRGKESGAVPPRTLLVLFFPRAAPSEHPPSNGWLCSPADHPNPKSQIPPCAPSARLLQHPVAHPSSPHPIPVPCARLAAHRRCPFLLADCLQPHSKPHGAFQGTPHILLGPGLAWRVPQGLSPSPFRGGTRTSLSLPREFSGIWGFCVSKGDGEGTWR